MPGRLRNHLAYRRTARPRTYLPRSPRLPSSAKHDAIPTPLVRRQFVATSYDAKTYSASSFIAHSFSPNKHNNDRRGVLMDLAGGWLSAPSLAGLRYRRCDRLFDSMYVGLGVERPNILRLFRQSPFSPFIRPFCLAVRYYRFLSALFISCCRHRPLRSPRACLLPPAFLCYLTSRDAANSRA